MEERIKLIWDFRGPDSQKTAEHHVIHLDQYAQKESLLNPITGIDIFSEMHTGAYLVVDKSNMMLVRDALKPHRATMFT